MADAARGEASSVLTSLCGRCRYDLRGLAGRADMVVCPECGLEQVPAPFEGWPTGLRAAGWLCGVTFALCNLCAVLLLVVVLWRGPGNLAPILLLCAAATAVSGPVVPIASALILASRRGSGGGCGFIALGWVCNFLIGMVYLMGAVVVEVLVS